MPSIVNYVVNDMVIHDHIKSEHKGKVLKTLLMKHKYVNPTSEQTVSNQESSLLYHRSNVYLEKYFRFRIYFVVICIRDSLGSA